MDNGGVKLPQAKDFFRTLTSREVGACFEGLIESIHRYSNRQTEFKGDSYEHKTIHCVGYFLFGPAAWLRRMCNDVRKLFQDNSADVQRRSQISP